MINFIHKIHQKKSPGSPVTHCHIACFVGPNQSKPNYIQLMIQL